MLVNSKRMIVAIAAVGFLGTGPTLSSPPTESPPAHEEDRQAIPSARASIFLAEIRAETADLLAEIRTEKLELNPHLYAPGRFSRGTHNKWRNRAPFLERAKEHMSSVGESIAKLQHIRHFVLPWQKEAIIEVASHATRVSASLQAVIDHLHENQNRLFVSQYRDHLATLARHSGEMEHVLDKFLDNEKVPKVVHLLHNGPNECATQEEKPDFDPAGRPILLKKSARGATTRRSFIAAATLSKLPTGWRAND